MASKIGICNSALIKLGASTIMSLTDEGKNAALCNEQYGKVLDDVLRQHPWNFAIAREKLALLTDVPAFGFARAFRLPADWLRVVAVHDNEAGAGSVSYRIEGRRLMSDSNAIFLRYVRSVTDPNDMPATFREALAWRLALDLSQAITQSTTMQEAMRQGFRSAFAAAKAVDAVEDFPDDQPVSGWVAVRG